MGSLMPRGRPKSYKMGGRVRPKKMSRGGRVKSRRPRRRRYMGYGKYKPKMGPKKPKKRGK